MGISREAGDYHPGPMQLKSGTLLKIHGYREPARAPAMVTAAAHRMIRCAQTLSEPMVRYRTVSMSRLQGGGLLLNGSVVYPGADAERALSASVAAVIVVLTLGARLDEEAARLRSRGDMLEALFLETAGWLGIESVTRSYRRWFRSRVAGDGYTLTRRVAPGYGTWPLAGQRTLFAAFGDAGFPVRLMDSCAMIPKMSRSGIFGLNPPVSPTSR